MAEYVPTWLYHQDGRRHVCQSLDEEARLRQEEGWADTPAAHGEITAPSAEELAKIPRVLTPSAMQPGAEPQEQMAFSHLLLQWQQKLDTADQQMHEAIAGVDTARNETDRLRSLLASLEARVQTLEQYVVVQEGSHDDPKPRRRSKAGDGEDD